MKYILLLYILHAAVYALSPSDLYKINQRNTTIILQDNERQKFKKQSQQINSNIIDTDIYDLENENEVLATKNCFMINKFIFHNTKVLTQGDLRPVINFYQNRCLSQTHISNLLKHINNIYISKGYITSQAYIQAQDLSSGLLHIYLFEGKLDNILFNNKESIEALTAFPNLQGKILNLRDIEMGLDQLNRLPKNQATLSLQASKKEGYSNINIINEEKYFLSGSATINSTGIESTGKGQGSFQLYADNILNLNSQLSLNVNGSLEQLDEKRSQGYSINWSIPYGYFLFNLGYREFLYRSTIYGENSNYISSGISESYYTNLDYTFYRDKNLIIKANIGLDFKQNLNFIANELIQTSSIKLTIGNIGLSTFYIIDTTSINTNFTLHQGLDLFDPMLNSYHAYKKAQFTKYTANINLNTSFIFKEIPLTLSSSIAAQYSNDKLYSTELISIGGFYTVRGFQNMGYYGEIGAYAHNDISYYKNISIFGETFNISPYIGFDIGAIEYDKDIYKYMIGAGLGIDLSYKKFSLSFDFGIPMYAYDSIAEEIYTSTFSLNYYF